MSRRRALRLAVGLAAASLVATGCSDSQTSIPSETVTSKSAVVSPPASGAATPSAPSSSTAGSPRIDLQPLTISFRGKLIARLFADGRTESAGQNAPGTVLVPGPTLLPDGTMIMTKGGVRARLDDDGNIYVLQPPGVSPREPLFGRITGDELRFAGSDRPWSVRVRGNLIEFGEDKSSQIDGDVTPGMRHTALVMAAAFTIDGAIAGP